MNSDPDQQNGSPLQKALHAEMLELKLYGQVTISHISGIDNVHADALSRIGADLRTSRRLQKPDKVQAIEEPADFPVSLSTLPEFLEYIAADSYDFSQFMESFRFIWLTFDTLCNRFDSDRDPILDLCRFCKDHSNQKRITFRKMGFTSTNSLTTQDPELKDLFCQVASPESVNCSFVPTTARTVTAVRIMIPHSY
jgi:hypothetical protein